MFLNGIYSTKKERNTIKGIRMNKTGWEKLIKQQCEDAKTYKPYFDSVIETLAQTLETRDKIHEQWVKEGCNPTIVNTTDRSGKENVHKNPLLSLESEYNSLALKYWVELGLTSRSLKAIQKTLADDDSNSLADVLKTLGGK